MAADWSVILKAQILLYLLVNSMDSNFVVHAAPIVSYGSDINKLNFTNFVDSGNGKC